MKAYNIVSSYFKLQLLLFELPSHPILFRRISQGEGHHTRNKLFRKD